MGQLYEPLTPELRPKQDPQPIFSASCPPPPVDPTPLLPPVAIQCLETTFKISSSDCHLAAPQPLKEIFLNSLLKVGTPDLISSR